MAPSGRTITAATTTTTKRRTTRRRRIRHPRRTSFKKKEQKNRVKKKEEIQEKMKNGAGDSSSKTGETVENNIAEVIDDANSNNSVCSTPKGQRFRIPEISTCPPAPKKKRMMTSSNCSLRRSPLSFFSHPDLDLFFFMALRDVSV